MVGTSSDGSGPSAATATPRALASEKFAGLRERRPHLPAEQLAVVGRGGGRVGTLQVHPDGRAVRERVFDRHGHTVLAPDAPGARVLAPGRGGMRRDSDPAQHLVHRRDHDGRGRTVVVPRPPEQRREVGERSVRPASTWTRRRQRIEPEPAGEEVDEQLALRRHSDEAEADESRMRGHEGEPAPGRLLAPPEARVSDDRMASASTSRIDRRPGRASSTACIRPTTGSMPPQTRAGLLGK